jgi:Asp-tRNA(Asn)/Glu-tRNA(Gln) amidotransferase C subunit
VGEIDFNRLTHCMSLLSSEKETEIVATDLYDILESAPKIQDLTFSERSTSLQACEGRSPTVREK